MKKRIFFALLMALVILCSGCEREAVYFLIENQTTGLQGFADQKGKIVIECQYDGCDFMLEDVQYTVAHKGEQYMLIDKAGNMVFSVNCPLIYYPEANLCMTIEEDLTCIVLDVEGKQRIPGEFEDVDVIDQRYACVKQNGEVFLYDLETNEQRKLAEGKTVQNVNPWIKQPLFAYTEGKFDWALNQWTEKWGVVDAQGNEILPPTYNDMTGYSENRAFGYFMENGSAWPTKVHMLNEKGEILKELDGGYLAKQPFENGRAGMEQQNVGFGIIDEKGNWIIDPTEKEYRFSYLRVEGEIIHGITRGRHVFYDLDGKKLFETSMEFAKYRNGYIAFSDEEKGSGLMNLSGKIVTRFPEGYMWTN